MSVDAVEYACPWPTDDTCLTDEWSALDDDVKALALAYASATLERLTAWRVGVCPLKLRPALQGASGACWGGVLDRWASPGPVNWNGSWSNAAVGFRRNEVVLPPPVGRIDEVKVDGAALDPGDYALQNGHILVWRGTGVAPWPVHQDTSLADTEIGTMSVTYLNAAAVNEQGAHAVTLLAIQFAKACIGKTCQLPANVTQLVRQGVSMTIASGAFPGGETGLRQVDAYTAIYNPRRQTQRATVYSPDLPDHRVEVV